MRNRASALFLCLLLFPPIARSQQPTIPDAADLEIALRKLNVLGSVLYVGAHPDDENTSALAYFSKGRKYRSAYLSLTRGEGGQNLIGPEQGVEIGILRTQELMSARRIDGAEQFFTRAVDFGYSKTATETFEFWGRDNILSDIVWVIRVFRPDIIMARFTAENTGGHGHHQAAAILTREAFDAAGDPSRFPEQLKRVAPWKPKRLLWNSFRQAGGGEAAPPPLRIDTGEYNPLLGKSYAEMAGESRSNHKSQGFGSSGRRGTQLESFEVIAGEPAKTDVFDGIDATWNRVPGGKAVGTLLEGVLADFDPASPAKSVPGLLGVSAALDKLEDAGWVSLKKEELRRVIQGCAGLWMDAIADDYAAAPGDSIRVRATLINRSDQPIAVKRLGFPGIGQDAAGAERPLKANEPAVIDTTITIPKDYPISQPYWLETPPQPGLVSVRNPEDIGRAENPPPIRAVVELNVGGRDLEYVLPVVFRWTDPVNGELYRMFEVRPPVTMRIEDKVRIFTGQGPQTVKVRLKSHSRKVAGILRLDGAADWRVTPAEIPFALEGKYQEAEVAFEVVPPKDAREAVLRAEAEVGGARVGRDCVEIAYPHIRRQVYFPESTVKVVKLDVKTRGKKAGYIMGAGDEVAASLTQLGYGVTMLSDEMLENADLSGFDVIVTGVRAYNTRERLKASQDRLLQYVERGGTLVVQYNVASGQLPARIGPYPLTVGRDRVCVETAPVTFVAPNHPLLNFPNKIVAADFDGWIQERGLYFASPYDSRYEAVLASHDPGEPDRPGGLLFAKYGKGVYVFTALAFFRQLPAGVPGAFRLWANIISAGSSNGQPQAERK